MDKVHKVKPFTQQNPLTARSSRAATNENTEETEQNDHEKAMEAWADSKADENSGVEVEGMDVGESASKQARSSIAAITEQLSPQKNLQTLIELVFTYLQVYANTFSFNVEWPIEWSNFVNIVFIPFSLNMDLAVPKVDAQVRQ